MVVSLNYCSQNGGNLYRGPYYNGNPNIGSRTIGNLDQYPHTFGVQEKGDWFTDRLLGLKARSLSDFGAGVGNQGMGWGF